MGGKGRIGNGRGFRDEVAPEKALLPLNAVLRFLRQCFQGTFDTNLFNFWVEIFLVLILGRTGCSDG
jgi:hypothetical protein